MKIQYLEQIIARIQSEIHCPKCKHSFRKDQIEVSSVQKNKIDFSTRCNFCGAESHISANIGAVSAKKQNQLLLPSFDSKLTEDQRLGFDSVKGVLDALHSFKGKDVRELFNDVDTE